MECRLKEILDEKGMKQKFLADKAGVSIGTMSAIVRGRTTPTLFVAMSIAEALDMKIEDIWIKK